MNVLLELMASSLADLSKGLHGQLNMSDASEELVRALSVEQVPGRNPAHQVSWERVAWPSKKSLMSWYVAALLLLRAVAVLGSGAAVAVESPCVNSSSPSPSPPPPPSPSPPGTRKCASA